MTEKFFENDKMRRHLYLQTFHKKDSSLAGCFFVEHLIGELNGRIANSLWTDCNTPRNYELDRIVQYAKQTIQRILTTKRISSFGAHHPMHSYTMHHKKISE